MAWDLKNLSFSLGAALIAITLMRRWRPEWQQTLHHLIFIQGANSFDKIWYAHLHFAESIRNIIQTDSLSKHLLTVVFTFSTGLIWLIYSLGMLTTITWPQQIPLNDVFVWLCLGKIVATIFVLKTKSPILSILFLGLVGYLFAVVLALAGAPDLAMTQFSVETLSVLVLLYALKGVPEATTPFSMTKVSGVVISIGVGVAVTLATGIASLSVTESRLRDFFAQTSWLEAHGRNVVNVILVDYRALDTMGEISVLGIAALGVYLLLSSKDKGQAS